MNNNTNNTGDEHVTITEALKRLSNQNVTPARQSFYAAIGTGKILEVTAQANSPEGKRMVAWASVLEYIEHGGFKPRRKHTSTTDGKTEAASPATGLNVPAAQIPPASAKIGMPNPLPTESPQTQSSANAESPSPGHTPAKPSDQASPNHSNDKRKSAAQGQRAMPKVQVKPPGNGKSEARHSQSLRVIKNRLRHLDFDQTKAIRDWADNRLLTVLRPSPPLASSDGDNKILQPA